MGAKFLAVLEGRKRASVFEMKTRITVSLRLKKREQSAQSPNRQALGMRWQQFRGGGEMPGQSLASSRWGWGGEEKKEEQEEKLETLP